MALTALRIKLALLFQIVILSGAFRHMLDTDLEAVNASGDSSPRQDVSCVDCPEYVELSAQSKQDVLWKRIISDEYPKGALPMDFPSLLTVNFIDLKAMALNTTMPYTFDRYSDENPTGHAKVIHTFGSVANVRLEPVPNSLGLTGMFQGGDRGLIRLSIVADWTKYCKGGTDLNFNGCFKPSLALKMLRDHDFSSNLVAQVNLGDGVGRDFNFFNHTHATWLPTPYGMGAELVKFLFSYAANKKEIGGVGLTELASQGSKADQDPSEIKAPKFVYLVPHERIKHRFRSEEHDVREDFDTIEVGTPLYDVIAPLSESGCFVKPSWPWNPSDPVAAKDLSQSTCPHTVVARVVTTSRFVASAWGDRRLFFQHERVDGGKGGPWRRQACALSSADTGLPDSNAYRMPNDWTRTCTQSCMYGTRPVPEPCPFAKLG